MIIRRQFLLSRTNGSVYISNAAKVNVLGIVEVLKKLSNTLEKENHETTPPYLRDQFTTCDLTAFKQSNTQIQA